MVTFIIVTVLVFFVIGVVGQISDNLGVVNSAPKAKQEKKSFTQMKADEALRQQEMAKRTAEWLSNQSLATQKRYS